MPTLKQTMAADAASALLFAVLCLGFTDTLSYLTGLPVTVVAAAGWICVPCVALFSHQALRPSRTLMSVVVIGNIGWVLASIAVWVAHFGQLTALGHALLIAQALAVELLTTLEWRGLRTLTPRAAAA